MDTKMTQKNWLAVIMWAGLLAATAYTSNAILNVFNAIIQALFQGLAGDISNLFKDYGLLFATILGIGLIFLLLSTWLGLVTYTFEIGSLVFGKEKEEDNNDDDDEESSLVSLPGQVARYLAFTWGLFYILFLILPLVM